jgi:uncharacterized membrane protein HdeD (DUF308 family)
MLLVFAVYVLVGAQGCVTGAGRHHLRSTDAQRTFALLFCACGIADVVVGLVASASHNAGAEAIDLVAGALIVFGALRWAREVKAMG